LTDGNAPPGSLDCILSEEPRRRQRTEKEGGTSSETAKGGKIKKTVELEKKGSPNKAEEIFQVVVTLRGLCGGWAGR